MRTQKIKLPGFTLIELIATLVLSSIVAVFAGMFVQNTTQIFVSSRDAAEDTQKIQIALNRLVDEFTYAKASEILLFSAQNVQWVSGHPRREDEECSIVWDGINGSDLILSTPGFPNKTLIDNVNLFTIDFDSEALTITLRTRSVDSVSQRVTVYPINP